MKKLVLSAFTIAVALNVSAQRGSTYIKDDFSATAPYIDAVGKGGIYFWGGKTANTGNCFNGCPPFAAGDTTTYIVTRGGGKLTVEAKNATNFNPFGLSFGDSNGDGTGTTITQSFGSNIDIKFTVKNTSATETAFITIQLQDINGGISEILPDTGTTNWGDKKKPNSGVLAPGAVKNVVVDLSSIPSALGGYKAVSWLCGTPNACPLTAYTIDVTKISKVLFFVNGPGSLTDINAKEFPGEGPYTGTLEFSNFSIGTIPTGISDIASYSNSSLYPNPTSDVANITLDLKEVADVKIALTDMFGKQVKVVAEGRYSSINEKVNVSDLAKGVYTVNYMVNGAAVKNKLLLVK